MIGAILFDLDDTLYEQRQWLEGAWHAVAARAARSGVDRVRFEEALRTVAAGGSDKGQIIDRALAHVDMHDVPVGPLVAAFRDHAPTRLDPYPGVVAALEDLHARVPLGLISDGDVTIQRTKLDALGLGRLFSSVVLSDELGRSHRKPDPLPFRVALEELGVDAAHAVYIGDRPSKDVVGAAGAGLRAVRVRTGEWRDEPDDPRAWASVPAVLDAVEVLRRALAPGPGRPSVSVATPA